MYDDEVQILFLSYFRVNHPVLQAFQKKLPPRLNCSHFLNFCQNLMKLCNYKYIVRSGALEYPDGSYRTCSRCPPFRSVHFLSRVAKFKVMLLHTDLGMALISSLTFSLSSVMFVGLVYVRGFSWRRPSISGSPKKRNLGGSSQDYGAPTRILSSD